MTAEICPCGAQTPTEAGRQRHATECQQQHLPGCRVTVHIRSNDLGRGVRWIPERCGKACVHDGLCAGHLGDRARLGGAS